MPKVIVGMSGGADSAVAALLLKQQGYDVVGVTLRTWVSETGEDSRCCEIDDVRSVCEKVGIPFHVFNCVSQFEHKVIKPFMDDYLHGLTPNPCVVCNREIKWEQLLYHANVLGADYIATGHYAHIVKLNNGRYTVKKALHTEKDQAYMLYRLSQEDLARTLMPLGDLSKDEVRKIAEESGLTVASKPDSQEICFVTEGDYADFIEGQLGKGVSPEGNYIDEDGNVLGRHKGIIHYTVGQRKRLGIALGKPAYIKEIRPQSNEIVLSTDDDTYCRTVFCRDCNFQAVEGLEDGQKIRCTVKVRYRHAGQYAVLEKDGEDRVKLTFEEPVRSATPGQSAVFYDDDGCLIGGGFICGTVYD